jgi:ABC-type Fe3+/spermidine/putrescine transport system ATPase subunit
MDTAVLEFRQVSKRFASHTAVDGISLSVGNGTFFSLLGPSGCGKTTTLRLAAGFEQPDAGDVLLSGVRINDMRPYDRNVSTVFQNYALFPHLTVRGNIEFGLRRKRAAAIDDAVRRVIDLVQLAGKESRKPSEISGGEKQRVALARSLVLAPDVLLLDEPLSALDPNLRKQMRAELKSVQRRVGIAFLFVTHDQEEALSLSDRIAVMNNGRIEQTGGPQDLYLRPATRFVAGFLGAMNWYNGIGIRPESTRVAPTPPAENGARVFPARVEEAVFLGNCLHIETRLATGERIVSEISRVSETYAAGDEVHVWWRPEDELQFPRENQ